MSRIGNNPINIPEGVTVEIQPTHITVKGKLGELTQEYSDVDLKMEENTITVVRHSDNKTVKSKHGLYRSLIANMIEGVSNGFTKELELVGVGYRASNQGQKLDLALGFSHNKQLVGYVAAKIRSFRKPEPYKGKGVKFVGEQIRKKAGKSP